MGYVPSPDPIKDPDMTDKEWYEYRRGELVAQREAMPDVSIWGVIAVAVILTGIIFLATMRLFIPS